MTIQELAHPSGPAVTPGQLDPVDAAISLAANHPAKMLSLLYVAREPGRVFTPSEIQNGLNEAQGSTPGWQWEHQGDGVRTYFANGLVTAGLAYGTEVVGRYGEKTAAFGVTEQGLEIGVPLFGRLLDLELQTEFSSQRTFGSTNTNTATLMRAPLLRLRVLQHVHNADGDPVSLGDLRRGVPRLSGSVDHAVEELTAEGILRVLHKTNPADRRLALAKPDMALIENYRSRMKPENRAIHVAAVALYRRGVRQLDGEMLVNEVIRGNPDITRSAIWNSVNAVPPHFMKFTDAALFGGNRGKKAPRTRIDIAERFEGIVDELLIGIDAVRHNAHYRELAAARAAQIIETPTAVAYLMGKARANSKLVRTSRQEDARRAVLLRERVVGWTSLKRELTFDADWRSDAACRKKDPELFFPVSEEEAGSADVALARDICKTCPAWLSCLKTATDGGEQYGIWGGYTTEERKNLPKSVRTLLAAVTVKP